MLKKKNLWRGLTMVFALLLAVSMMAGNILELYRTSVDAFLGTRSTQTVTEQSDDESDAWTYKSEFTTAKEAYEGFKDFAIETSQETFALLKNENGALPLARDAKITMLGVRSYAPVYGNSGGSVPDGKSTVQIFDAFTERGFQLNPETLAAYEAFFADKEWTKPQFGGGILPAYAEITAYDDPHELTLDELKQLNPDFESKYTEYGDAAIVVVGRVGGEAGAYYPGEEGLADGVHTVNGNILSLSDEEMAMIEEAKANFDKVIVLVSFNPSKRTTAAFTIEERMKLIMRVTEGMENVLVDCNSGLLADYLEQTGACAIVKGLRAVSDFEYEFQMALANKKLYPKAETVFLTTSTENMYLSSSVVKEIASLGGDISGFVPPEILDDIKERLFLKDHK